MATDNQVYRASTTAPVNIAVIKYWGKRDAHLNLPTNSSLSVTLSQADLCTHTTASCSNRYTTSSLTLNGKPDSLDKPRTRACIASLRSLRSHLEESDASLPKLSSMPLKLVSTNNFPTAAGLASSAAGFAALVRAIADLYHLPQDPQYLSTIARQGSGSACRSLFGGFVAWHIGASEKGTDSFAKQVAPSSYWPSLRAMVLVVSAAKKKIGSTEGMQATVATSPLFRTRAVTIVPQRMAQMEAAIKRRDFPAFATITMKDSNDFHAVCLDAFPPIFYMNDVSRAAIDVVHAINARAGEVIAAYTFDAGPNAVVYFDDSRADEVAGVFSTILRGKRGWEMSGSWSGKTLDDQFSNLGTLGVDESTLCALERGVERVVLTSIGEGPQASEEHLVDETGEIVTV